MNALGDEACSQRWRVRAHPNRTARGARAMKPFDRTRDALHRAWWSLRHEGMHVFLMKLLGELGYRRVHVLARSLREPVAPLPPSSITLDILGTVPFEEYALLRRDTTREALEGRARAGHVCFVARENGRIVAACWSATRDARDDYLGCSIPLEPGDVYFYNAFTAASHRGRNLARRVCARQLEHFRDAGFVRAVRVTVPENVAALRAHGKSGFVPVGMIARLRIGPWRRHFHRTFDRNGVMDVRGTHPRTERRGR